MPLIIIYLQNDYKDKDMDKQDSYQTLMYILVTLHFAQFLAFKKLMKLVPKEQTYNLNSSMPNIVE